MNQEHPFAPFVRVLGKGKKGSRSLTADEAEVAMGMILDQQVLPEQLGAFLMLIRMKEEAPEELMGFARAVKARLAVPEGIAVDLDWSSYAGKKRRLPWFLLAALLLAQKGTKVFMHGARGHTPGRLYTEDMLTIFGLQAAQNWEQVEQSVASDNFAFMSIDNMVPRLGEMIALRPILGLRSPVHTLCRLLNPLEAPCCVDGVFHPPYAPMHQKTSQLLGTEFSLTIRGDGGEAEMKPDSDSELHWVCNGELMKEEWPRMHRQRLVREDDLDPLDLLRLWRGEIGHEYGEGAVISTLAGVLRLLSKGEHKPVGEWVEQANALWGQRDKQAF
ncbi:glycosyl transferase family protein [Marinobacterium sediminicola]|uniref:Anthranilate phosphoribosyltransferase n=1 Tax=Marinobacterium sediminicola TaxID=518898 RepID=A0ABY1RX14_9GAMM|nr:glycosyl transferase family protein [Marinobacterium sediminicola]ULG67881.1 glycosyl transferase family protein [Marinobacterium sediminicola]SMR71415.1 Anthranilate phosphoribosyltransferase [Marinobacterium sediminicola]